nr:RusA family crossover junction endodeoxyribonuclease [Demequina sp. TTPB684]
MQTKQARRIVNGVSYGVGHARLVESTAHSKEWRAEVAWRVRQGLRSAGPVSGPVRVTVMSFLPQPKSNRDPMPTAKRTGDMDKIDRNVLDALTDAGAIVDDAQVVDLCSAKRWAADPAHPYTVIEVEAYPKESS